MPVWVTSPFRWLVAAVNLNTFALGLGFNLPDEVDPWSAFVFLGPLLVVVGPAARDEAEEVMDTDL
jgi:hypothetical protein